MGGKETAVTLFGRKGDLSKDKEKTRRGTEKKGEERTQTFKRQI
jgi:hypothetical protein